MFRSGRHESVLLWPSPVLRRQSGQGQAIKQGASCLPDPTTVKCNYQQRRGTIEHVDILASPGDRFVCDMSSEILYGATFELSLCRQPDGHKGTKNESSDAEERN